MLTEQPVQDIQGGCLGDAIGLGKTVQVLSTLIIFAMIKADYKEVASFYFYFYGKIRRAKTGGR